MRKNILLGIVGVAVVASGAFFFYDRGVKSPNESPTPTPIGGVPVGVSTLVPECQLGGQIVFVADKLFRSDGAAFSYQKVADPHDFIRWTIEPEEDVTVGPNRFSRLPLPAGRDTITIGFNQGKPQHKAYELRASIDYPYLVNNEVVVLNTKCSGVTKVRIDY